MGCCASQMTAAEPSMQAPRPLRPGAPRAPQQPLPTLLGSTSAAKSRQQWGEGNRLGGADASAPSADELRKRALEAAERRVAAPPGVSRQKAAELRERREKEELLGRLTEHYYRQKLDMPMGLNLASVEQLRKHWDAVKRDTA
mmetsp:Transcript_3056/g.7379  ORF Transcript_3056/g.7379 Transcript_3056/m.7379 type:complete len:143 (+) Transcript_3056:84-512(+)